MTTAEPVSYAKSRPRFERGMARDAVASATRDAGDIRCEVGIAPVFSWSRQYGHTSRKGILRTLRSTKDLFSSTEGSKSALSTDNIAHFQTTLIENNGPLRTTLREDETTLFENLESSRSPKVIF